jgi:hypothetical protein
LKRVSLYKLERVFDNAGGEIIYLPIVTNMGIAVEASDPLVSGDIKDKLLPAGWGTFSPTYYKFIKEKLGAENGYELIENMTQKDNVILVIEGTNLYIFNEYIQKYHNKIVLMELDRINMQKNMYAGIYRLVKLR